MTLEKETQENGTPEKERGEKGCPFSTMLEEIDRLCTQTFQKPGPDGSYRRMFHADVIASVRGHLEILPDLPEHYRNGLFSRAATYPVTARFSNAFFPQESFLDARGLAVTLHGTEGAVCEDAPEGQHTVLTACQKGFVAARPSDMLDLVRKLSRQKSINRFNLTPPSYVFPGLNPAKFRLRVMWSMLETGIGNGFFGRDLTRNSFTSITPYRLGEGAMKYHFRPAGATLGKGKTLRERLGAHLQKGELVYDFLIQPRAVDSDSIDDATKAWKSPLLPVGRLTFPVQDIFDPALLEQGEALAYSPWHCLAAHEPLGSINAIRRVVYRNSAQRRNAKTARVD